MTTPNPTTQASNNFYDDNLDTPVTKPNVKKPDNSANKKSKTNKKYKIMQINKGTADFESKQELIKSNVIDHDADFILITEANHKHADVEKLSSLKKTFKGFKCEMSIQPNNDNCRCLLLIRNGINYERIVVNDKTNPIVAVRFKSKKHETTILLGHYRQWRMPGEGPANDSKGIKIQKERFEEFAKTVENVKEMADNLMIVGDINVDQNLDNEPWLRPEVRALQPTLDKIMTSNGLKRLNSEPTRHMQNQRSSLLDLILYNDPQSISNISNIKAGISDHDAVICELSCKDVEVIPQFYIMRDYRDVNASNMIPLIDNDDELQTLFNDRDADTIAEKLNNGLNNIVKKLMKKKRIQNRKNKYDFDDKELKNARDAIKLQSKVAHTSKNLEEERLLKNMKNRYTKLETKKKKIYEEKVLKKIKEKWKFIRNDDTDKTPVYVKVDNNYTSCQRRIANAYAEHTSNKIKNLTEHLPDKKDQAMNIFKSLIKRVDQDLVLRETNYREVYKIISNLKRSNSRGENEITNNILKEIPQYITLAIVHLFNTMIRNEKYPQAFKTSRIIPLLKKKKSKTDLDSFRPVNNLNPLAKITEELLKKQFDNFFETHKVIPMYHHGSRKSHSTNTANLAIQHTINSNQDKNKYTAIMVTDLSSAFETCQHSLLTMKAEHIGVRGNAQNLMKSYLEERKTFVEIQGYASEVKEVGDKSVVQGSKMASLNYTIYTLDIGKIDELITNPETLKPNSEPEEHIDEADETNHDSVSYVDDLSQLMANKSMLSLQTYIQKAYETSVEYFETNLLAINESKTELLIIPPRSEEDEEAYIMTGKGEVIASQNQIKILGVKFNTRNNMQSHVATLSSRVGMIFQKLKPYIKNAPQEQRKIILLSKLESVALYGAPLFFNESSYCIKRLELLLMRIYKWAYNKNTYMKKYSEICQELKVDEPQQKLLKTNTRFICKIMQEKKVDQLLSCLIINPRTGTKVYLADPHKNNSRSALVRHISLYNSLPQDLKMLNPSRLKRKLDRHTVTFRDQIIS